MRVLFLIYSLAAGGAERVTAGLANYWVTAGHEVTVVLWGAHEDGPEPAFVLDERVRVEVLGLGADSSSTLSAFCANWRRIKAVRSVLRERRPNVAIGMMTTASILLALSRGQPGMVRVGTERIYPPFADVSLAWRLIRPIAYARLQAVVAQTGEAALWLRRWTLAPRIKVIGNPILEGGRSGAVLPPESLLNGDARILLAVGRLAPQKQYEGLVDSFSTIARSRPDWHLVILGDGPERQRLEELVASSGYRQRIHLLGHVPNIEAWLNRADLFVMCSSFEGFPNALLEAYCTGVPCVSFDCLTGPSSIITSGRDGVLVSNGNFAELEISLGYLMDNPAQRQELASRAAACASRFDIGIIAAQWEALFNELEGRQ